MTEIIVTLRLAFRSAAVDTILPELLPIVQRTREEPGNLEFNVYRERDHPDQLILFERWVDQTALERHWQEDYTKRALVLFDENLLQPLSEQDDVTYLSNPVDLAPPR